MTEFTVGRNELLQALVSVEPGLSPKGLVEQSDSFVFDKGKVITFNDEVGCTAVSGLPKKFRGAVLAKPLMSLLERLKDDTITVFTKENEFRVKGKRRRAGVRMDKEITIPIETIEPPSQGDWIPLHEDFNEALSIVQECAGKDESQQILTCIHFGRKFIEACDDVQISRYYFDTRVQEPFLVKRDAIKYILSLDMTEFAETDTWVHFRNPAKVMLSCKRFVEKYEDLGPFLAQEGEPITIPRRLGEAAELAGVFSREDADNDTVLIEIKKGKMSVEGRGLSGWAREDGKLNYTGRPLSFRISPKLIGELCKKHNECQINDTHLRVDGKNWSYVTVLGAPDDVKEEINQTEEAGEEGNPED